jgi:hypothetical protein
MTDNEFLKNIREEIEQGQGFSKKVQIFLIFYKNSGGQQETAKRLVEDLAEKLSENVNLQNKAYDVLDIITGWCSPDMRVWDDSK